MPIKSRLHMLMAERKMSMVDLARETGLNRNTVGSFYHDRAKRIDYATLEAVCRYFGCQPGDVLVYTEETDDPAHPETKSEN